MLTYERLLNVAWAYAGPRAELRSFAFEALAPGRYLAAISIREASGTDHSRIYLPLSLEPREAEPIEIEAPETASWQGSLHSPARIEGRCSGGWTHLGLGTPEVRLDNPEMQAVARTRTHGAGSFGLKVYVPVDARIRVHLGGSRWLAGGSFEEATVFQLRAGEVTFVGEVLQLEIVPEEGGRITGRLLDHNGPPAAGVAMRVQGQGSEWPTPPILPTARDGTFLLKGLADGDYRLRALPRGAR